MSDEAAEELEPTPGEGEPNPGESEPAPEPEAKPAARGYQTREQWAESGKDPADYVSQEVFEAKGSLLKEIGKLKRENANQAASFESRLSTQGKLHAIALKNQVNNLEKQRDAAVEDADKDEVSRIQGQIDDNNEVISSLEAEPAPAPASNAPAEKAPEQVEWERNNAYIFDNNDPKSSHAKALYAKLTRPGADQASDYNDLFTKIDAEMAKAFPEVNPARNRHRSAEGGSSPGRPKAGALSNSDMTSDDVKYFVENGNSVVPGTDNVKVGNKTIRGVDKAAMMKMIAESRA